MRIHLIRTLVGVLTLGSGGCGAEELDDEPACDDHHALACEYPEVVFNYDYVAVDPGPGRYSREFFVGFDDCGMDGFIDVEPDGIQDHRWSAECSDAELNAGRELLSTVEQIAHYDAQSDGGISDSPHCYVGAFLPPNDERHDWRFSTDKEYTPEVRALLEYFLALRDNYEEEP